MSIFFSNIIHLPRHLEHDDRYGDRVRYRPGEGGGAHRGVPAGRDVGDVRRVDPARRGGAGGGGAEPEAGGEPLVHGLAHQAAEGGADLKTEIFRSETSILTQKKEQKIEIYFQWGKTRTLKVGMSTPVGTGRVAAMMLRKNVMRM